ncbi:MAG: tetratricopeptide repeat protein [Kiritimatiellaeota bacterium]|nr:tetratricopeptide repeat protein [Kiritimatiellota bacterium]
MPGEVELAKKRELASFFRASTLEFVNYPAAKTDEARRKAVAAYADFVKEFPDGENAPHALVKIGTLYSTLNDTKAAEQAFTRLANEYGDSAPAKNAVPLRARALMDLGFTAEAVNLYRQMFKDQGKYSPGQYFDAGQALLDARDYELAIEAFEIAMEKDNPAIQVEGLYGRARALYALRRHAEALAAVEEFEKKYRGYERILDVWHLMIQVCTALGENEKDNAKRIGYFNKGANLIKEIPRHDKTPEGATKADLAATRLLIKRMNAEKKFGFDKEARETCGRAISGYLGMLGIPPGNEKLAPYLHEAYKEGIPLFIEFGAPDIALEQCEKYLTTFPEGKYAPQVRAWLNQAATP